MRALCVSTRRPAAQTLRLADHGIRNLGFRVVPGVYWGRFGGPRQFEFYMALSGLYRGIKGNKNEKLCSNLPLLRGPYFNLTWARNPKFCGLHLYISRIPFAVIRRFFKELRLGSRCAWHLECRNLRFFRSSLWWFPKLEVPHYWGPYYEGILLCGVYYFRGPTSHKNSEPGQP